MEQARVRLAFVSAAAVVIVMVAATIAFNLFINWKVEADARYAIEWVLGFDEEDYGEPTRTATYIELDSGFQIVPSYHRRSTAQEVKLASWFADNPIEFEIVNVVLDGWTCYAALVPSGAYEEWTYEGVDGDSSERAENEYSGNMGDTGASDSVSGVEGYYLAYADVTSELQLIATVNVAFIIIGLLGLAGAIISGYATGKRIDEAQEAQKRFYENMSHELKTPLAAIRGYAEGARDGLVGTEEATRAITRETVKMTEMIDEILGLSRLEAGAVPVRKENIVVDDFVQDCLMPFEGAVRVKGVQVDLSLAEGSIEADPALFDHALSNVLSNAVRHAESQVRVSYDGTRLSVWNDGGAPAAEELSRLFDRFYTGSGSTGIGLAIAREIADLHSWSITARACNGGLEVAFNF